METTNTRTDIHRPSTIDPVDYTFVGCFYQGSSDDMQDAYLDDHAEVRDAIGEDWAFTVGVTGGNFSRKSTCDHCGARFSHGAIYSHTPTGEYLVVGHTCASTTLLPGVTAIDRRRALADRQAAAAKSERKNAEYRAEVLASNPGLAEAFESTNGFIADVARRFRSSHPELSEKQIAAVLKAAERDRAYAAEKAAQPTVPVVEGNGVAIVGTIVSTKWQDSDYGGSLKMLVNDDRGFKVWGTVPSSLDAERGDRVSFIANVEQSRNDADFGFFKRPRKAAILEAAA